MLPAVLLSVMSLLPLQISFGQHVAEDSCTVQILVPGLKGTLLSKFSYEHSYLMGI